MTPYDPCVRKLSSAERNGESAYSQFNEQKLNEFRYRFGGSGN